MLRTGGGANIVFASGSVSEELLSTLTALTARRTLTSAELADVTARNSGSIIRVSGARGAIVVRSSTYTRDIIFEARITARGGEYELVLWRSGDTNMRVEKLVARSLRDALELLREHEEEAVEYLSTARNKLLLHRAGVNIAINTRLLGTPHVVAVNAGWSTLANMILWRRAGELIEPALRAGALVVYKRGDAVMWDVTAMVAPLSWLDGERARRLRVSHSLYELESVEVRHYNTGEASATVVLAPLSIGDDVEELASELAEEYDARVNTRDATIRVNLPLVRTREAARLLEAVVESGRL